MSSLVGRLGEIYAMSKVLVLDGVLPDPEAYRATALARTFETINVGAMFHGISLAGDDPTLPDWIAQRFGLDSRLTFFRKSPEGQIEPNFIHTDCDMGEWTAILYLTPEPPEGDGTTFWRHTASGRIAIESGPTSPENLAEVLEWRDRDRWEPWCTVAARFNRLLVFPSAYYHSRALEANYGVGNTARLTQVLFGVGSLEGISL